MKPLRAFVVIAAVTSIALATVLGVRWYTRPPVDTPYFHWEQNADDRYALTVSHVGGNPDFHRGVTTGPVPQ